MITRENNMDRGKQVKKLGTEENNKTIGTGETKEKQKSQRKTRENTRDRVKQGKNRTEKNKGKQQERRKTIENYRGRGKQ